MAEPGDKSHVRKRKDASKAKDINDGIISSGDDDDPSPKKSTKDKACKVQKNVPPCQVMEAGSYWLTRIVFTRAIGFIYCTCDTQFAGRLSHFLAISQGSLTAVTQLFHLYSVQP